MATPQLWKGLLALAFAGSVIAIAVSAQEPADPTPPSAEPPSAEPSPHGALSLLCSDCHTTEGWAPLAEPRRFDHGAVAGLPLVGGHGGVGCFECHGDLRFGWVASSCADCHRDPHQGELGFSCAACHDARGWFEAQRTARARHATTLFPLTGAHAGLDCAACHGGTAPREFSLAPTDCFACHATDFQATRDPNHLIAGFPTTCETCHTTDEFQGAEFRAHDSRSFPIYSGPHEGVWGACSDCHVTPTTFGVVSCFACHPRAETDPVHVNVPGYVYESRACLACHPDGRRP